ncbi:MAG TPA: transcriptional repressor LexA [Alphaproteobacteria bacterium]|nr:transcriptional repressor LexA [Alphaproteobacteria bacterium]
MLTRKQQELLVFIHDRLAKDGISPSFDEMKTALRLKSKSGIHRLISGLEERGFIRRLPHRARALEVTRLPESLNIKETLQKTAAGVKSASQKMGQAVGRAAQAVADGIMPLPMLGRIAAGTAIEALRDNSRSIPVPSSMLGRGDHYVLEVAGDSMVEAGIFDGDSVVIQQCDSVDNGAIAVALIDDNEVTLKSLYRKGSMIDLVPANHNYQTMSYPADRVQVQGKLVGLMRKY